MQSAEIARQRAELEALQQEQAARASTDGYETYRESLEPTEPYQNVREEKKAEEASRSWGQAAALSTYSHRRTIKTREKRSILFFPSGGQGWDRDLPPNLESVLHLLPVVRCGEAMAVRTEVLRDGTRGGKEPLRLTR